jgi:hypothetical protein
MRSICPQVKKETMIIEVPLIEGLAARDFSPPKQTPSRDPGSVHRDPAATDYPFTRLIAARRTCHTGQFQTHGTHHRCSSP